MPAGSSGCWRNWDSSYGSEIPRRSRRSGCESRRRTAWMPRCCCSYYWRIAFLGCGYPARKIETCVSCCGIGIGWYRCARIMNQLQTLAMNEGVRRRAALWSKSGRAQLESVPLAPWAARRRHDLLELLDRLNPTIEELSAAVEQQAQQRPEVLRLMTHPGVGPITALAFVLIIDSAERFACGKQIASYVGLIPGEDSS